MLEILFIFDRLGSLCQTLDLEPLCSLEELWELILSNIHLPSVHELKNGSEMGKGHVLEDDDGVLGRVLLQQSLEVGAASREDHLVSLAALPLTGNGHVCEGLLIPQVLEGGHHVGLEVIPPQAELLLILHFLV